MTTPVKVLLWLSCVVYAIAAIYGLREAIDLQRHGFPFDLWLMLMIAGCAVLALLYGCAAAGLI
jgi:succinate dehydrogenase hydrophobic anchor subunit